MLKFTTDHEWIKLDGDVATVGISDYAAKALGDVVFVELPDVGAEVDAGAELAVVESVKAASEVYAICSGEVTEVNEELADAPTTVNENAEGDGWLYKVKISDAAELEDLMDAAAYQELLKDLDE